MSCGKEKQKSLFCFGLLRLPVKRTWQPCKWPPGVNETSCTR